MKKKNSDGKIISMIIIISSNILLHPVAYYIQSNVIPAYRCQLSLFEGDKH